MSDFPRKDSGFFHLTPKGWSRQDHEPFPDDRVETWRYETVCPAADAKEQVCLTRIWSRPDTSPQLRDDLRGRFGQPLTATLERNVVLECHV